MPKHCKSILSNVYAGTCDMGTVCIFYETSANGSPDKAPENPSGGDCKDKSESCSGWKDYCQGQYKAYMEKNCPKTCGACPKSPAGPTQSSCDMSKTFGKLNGKHILTFTANGGYYFDRFNIDLTNGVPWCAGK